MGCRDTTHSFLIVVTALMCIGQCGGGLMHHMMMKHMHHKDHHEKSLKIHLKPIPIPIPVAYMEPPMKKEKPWPEESKMKGMMWKMMKMKMKMKMKMMKKMKGMMKAKKCCPASQEKAGWPMMPVMPMHPMICPQMMMNQCDMAMNPCPMKAGWPMKGDPCPPEEEEEAELDEEDPPEVEDWPEYYDTEQQEDMNGWDSNLVPVVVAPNPGYSAQGSSQGPVVVVPGLNSKRRRGDDLDEMFWVEVPSMKGNSFDYDFDYVGL